MASDVSADIGDNFPVCDFLNSQSRISVLHYYYLIVTLMRLLPGRRKWTKAAERMSRSTSHRIADELAGRFVLLPECDEL